MLAGLFPAFLFSQTNVLDADFESGIPAEWYVFSGNGITWTANDSVGANGSKGVWARSSVAGEAWLRTPVLDLSESAAYSVEFTVALVGYLGAAPDLQMRYRTDDQDPDEFIALSSWGSDTAENQISQTQNDQSALDEANVDRVTITYNLEAITGDRSTVRLWFGADMNGAGWALLDDVRVIKTPFPTGITTAKADESMKAWPNPTRDVLNIALDGRAIQEITVYNAVGQLVLSQSVVSTSAGQATIQMNSVAPGTYSVLVKDATGRITASRVARY